MQEHVEVIFEASYALADMVNALFDCGTALFIGDLFSSEACVWSIVGDGRSGFLAQWSSGNKACAGLTTATGRFSSEQ